MRGRLSCDFAGEAGTGKETVARLIHARRGVRGGFLALSAAAVPESLAEAELFGIAKRRATGPLTLTCQHLPGWLLCVAKNPLFLETPRTHEALEQCSPILASQDPG